MMAVFTIQAPDGRKIKIQAPDQDTALRGAQEWVTANPVDAPPAGAQPGSKAYADWAVAQARAGKKLPQVSEAPEFQAPQPTDIMSKLLAGSGSFIEGVPVAGPTLINLAKQGRAAFQGMTPEAVTSEYDAAKAANPITSTASGIGGAIASLAPFGATALGGKLLGMTGSLPSRLAMGGLSGSVISGADTAARGGDMGNVMSSALLGGAIGTALPALGGLANKVGNSMAQRAATNTAIKGAPAASDLKSVASGMFQQLDQSGVAVAPSRLQKMASDLVQTFVKKRANPNLDPKSLGALTEVVKAVDEAMQSGSGLVLSDLHTLRQIAQKAAQSAEGRDQMFASQIINSIDDMISSLKPADIIGGADPKQAANLMFDAIGTWGRARRVGLIEEAIYKAQNVASGVENGLRIEFRKLVQNPETRKLFTAAERQAIEDVVRGNAVANVTKLLGKFGFGTNGAGNMLGGTIGFGAGTVFGGPIAGMVAAGAGTAARKASEALTSKAAQRAAQVVATPNVPTVPLKALPPAWFAPAAIASSVTN